MGHGKNGIRCFLSVFPIALVHLITSERISNLNWNASARQWRFISDCVGVFQAFPTVDMISRIQYPKYVTSALLVGTK